jgi:hypothetical protein
MDGDDQAVLAGPSTCKNSVELRGFEPLTPSMRTRCATGLRYSPENLSQPSKPRGLPAPRITAPRFRSPGRSGTTRCHMGVALLEWVARRAGPSGPSRHDPAAPATAP